MISQIDSELIDLLAERMAVARRIGTLKLAKGLNIRDSEIEARILSAVEKKAEEENLPAGTVRQLFESIINASVEEQKTLASKLEDSGKAGQAVIYGGAGGMGRLMAELLLSEGYHVTIIRSSGAVLTFPDMRDDDRKIGDSDLSIVSVPISKTAEIIERSATEIPGRNIYEICSVKSHLKEAISRAEDMGSKVISMHPMFGPSITSFRNRPVLFCDADEKFDGDPIWNAFIRNGARCFQIPFDIHDRLISYILQMAHALNIIFVTALSESGIEYEELKRAASPIFDRQLINAQTVSNQDPKLYFEIQRLSGHMEQILSELKMADEKLREALRDDSGEKFELLLKNGKRYFDGG